MKSYQKLALATMFVVFLGGFAGAFLVGNDYSSYDGWFNVYPVEAADSDSAEGWFILDSTPAVSNVDYVNDTYDTVSAIDPGTASWWRLNFTIQHDATIADILNCTIYIYDDSVYGATYNTSSPDGLQLVVFKWNESNDAWTVDDQGSFTEWTVDSGNSDDPGAASGSSQYTFSMRFRASRAARYDTDWNATVHCYDDDDDWHYDSESALITMNQYFELSFSTATFTWGSDVQQNSVNDTHGALSITCYANDDWELRINATDFNDSVATWVDIEAQNIVVLDEDGTFSGSDNQWIRNTIATVTFATWDGQSAMSDESGFNRNVYIGLNTGTYFQFGEVHASDFTIWIQADV